MKNNFNKEAEADINNKSETTKVKNLSNLKAGNAFSSLVKAEKDKLINVLYNWSEAELNDDADKIIRYPGRDSHHSHGKEGGKILLSKKSFFDWLYSDGPFDTKVYGEEIKQDKEWAENITTLRSLAGLENHYS